ncbi:DUF1254 domain-containing protein [Tsukamurella sp. 1534]|uniref:DUF1254 domain-containing protein n=1 Tax=Tsukamurella sp. 1534 TaxID=1151061 RepID=UPI0002DA32D6|nr:DUF1254 domain-containing protein [Tsukamurella sp. 1534]
MAPTTVATSCRNATTEESADTATNAFRLGFDAYVWGYPLVLMLRTRNALIDPTRRRPSLLNTASTIPRLLTDRDHEVVKPNNDTIYVIAWLDLSEGPVTVTVPAIDRYYGLQFLDAYTETFGYIGTRETGSEAASYTVRGPGGGSAAAGSTVLEAPTDTVWMLGRVLVEGPDDLAAARTVAQSVEVVGPTVPTPVVGPEPSPHTVSEAGLGFFDELSTAMCGNPAPAADASLVARLEAAGIGPGRVPSRDITDTAVRAGLRAGMSAAHAVIAASDRGLSSAGGDWEYDLGVGRYDGDHMLRAVVALNALGALTAEEAVYANAGADADGERFDGRRRYLLHFAADQLPPVDGFWSLTMYDEQDFLTANPIGRFAIGDRTDGIRYGTDGSLAITIAHVAPEDTANWLPAPEGPFQLTLRLYLPRAEVLEGTYRVPSVRLIDEDLARDPG